MTRILRYNELIEGVLPSYNPYSDERHQKEIMCPNSNCQSTEAEFIGPGDYIRNDNGDYRRALGYICKKCGQVFSVDKK